MARTLKEGAAFIAERLRNHLAIGLEPKDVVWIIEDAMRDLMRDERGGR